MLRTTLILAFGAATALAADYAVILRDEPVAQRVGARADLAAPAAAGHWARVRGAQSALAGEIARRGIPMHGAVQVLLNAIFVSTTLDGAAELRPLAGVKAVVKLPRLKRHLDRALDLTGAPQAWNTLGGAANAGAGVKIGILDSGIDHTHAAFQDTSLQTPAGFPKGEALYCNTKIIAARSYASQLPFAEGTVDYGDPVWSKPDDLTPRDRDGHGTALAMIAAGARVTGPLAAIQGVAPKAWLGNYKIFGSPQVNDYSNQGALIRALDDAFRDGMDIAVVAVGGQPDYAPTDNLSECGGDCDVYAQTVERAVQRGMTVVVSAGNDGNSGLHSPTLSTINTPGTAPSAITVGATTNSHLVYAGVIAGGATYDALVGDGVKLAAVLSAPLRDVASLGNDGLACSPLPAGSLDGAVALIQRGTCTYSEKILNAQNAGALAVVLYQSTGIESPVNDLGAQDTGIPAVGVAYASGLALKSFTGTVTLDPKLHASEAAADVVAEFSSRGPAIGTYGIKPELVAPGTNLYTAAQRLDPNGGVWDPSGFAAVSGSSFAAGLVAGAAALVKQANPNFSPAQVKSALVNSAAASVQDSAGAARVTAVGAGKLSARDALAVTATFEPAAISFGWLKNVATLDSSLTVRVTNTSSAAVTLTLAVRQRDADSRAAVTVAPASLALAPGQRDSVVVRLRGSLPTAGSYEGFVEVTGTGPTLRLPYVYYVGSGVPYDMVPVFGGFTTFTGDPDPYYPEFRLIDRFGVEVPNYPVDFGVAAGGGRISKGDPQTYPYGVAGCEAFVGNQAGDQIFTVTVAGQTMRFYGYARPKQAVRDVVNAATFALGPFAPGSYISIRGTNLAPTLLAFTSLGLTSLPLALSTVSVSFDAAGQSLPGRLHFVSPGQINVQIPWELQGQSQARLKVNIGDVRGSLVTIPLASYSPGLFQYEDGGQTVAAALDAGYKLIGQANPARKGQVVQLFGTGLGPVSNRPQTGEPSSTQSLSSTSVLPTATIGGRPAPVSFSGLTPGSVGLYQINVTVPSDAPSGVQPVVISIGGVDSRPGNLPVQ